MLKVPSRPLNLGAKVPPAGCCLTVSNHPSKKTHLLAVTVKHQVWKDPSPLHYCSCVNLFTVSMRPRAKRFPTVTLQQPSALFLQQQNKPVMPRKTCIEMKKTDTFLQKNAMGLQAVNVCWLWRATTVAAIKRAAKPAWAKALDAPEERATQVRGWGCVLGTSCGGGCFLSTHWAPSWPPVLASLTSVPGEEFIFAASCAATEKKNPSILSSKILFDPSWTVAKGACKWTRV